MTPPPDKIGRWRVYRCERCEQDGVVWRGVGDWQAARHRDETGHEPKLYPPPLLPFSHGVETFR